MEKSFYSGTMKKSVKVHATKKDVWRTISNIVGLDKWVTGVKKAIFQTNKKRGVGAIRTIFFEDGNKIEEHVVGWKNEEYFSYIATSGLPLRAYHATISLNEAGKGEIQIIWESYFNSKKMSKKEFGEFVSFLGSFYQESLCKLKEIIEK